MPPRFSIFSLLAFTTYAAVATVSVIDPLSPWSYAVFPLWIVVVIWCASYAMTRTPALRAFAHGFLLTSMVIVATEMLSGLPTTLAALALRQMNVVEYYDWEPSTRAYNDLLTAHGSLWIASIGGVVAVWRAEKIDAQPPPLE